MYVCVAHVYVRLLRSVVRMCLAAMSSSLRRWAVSEGQFVSSCSIPFTICWEYFPTRSCTVKSTFSLFKSLNFNKHQYYCCCFLRLVTQFKQEWSRNNAHFLTQSANRIRRVVEFISNERIALMLLPIIQFCCLTLFLIIVCALAELRRKPLEEFIYLWLFFCLGKKNYNLFFLKVSVLSSLSCASSHRCYTGHTCQSPETTLILY